MTTEYYWNDYKNTYSTLGELMMKVREKLQGLTEEKFNECVYDMGYTPITREMCKEFYRDLCGTVYDDPNKANCGVMPTEMGAEYMNMTLSKATAFLYAARDYGITERQSGAWVI